MSSFFVVDAHALLHAQGCGYPAPVFNEILNQMTDKIKEDSLFFPTQVVSFCRSFAKDEVVTVWANAVSGHRSRKSPNADFQTLVLDIVEEIADPDDTEEFPSLFVAAMALEMRANSSDLTPTVVTEDRLEQPTRVCLWEACEALELPRIGVEDYISSELLV